MANPFLAQTRPKFVSAADPRSEDKARIIPEGFVMTGRLRLLFSCGLSEGSQRGRFQGLYGGLYFLGMGGYAAYG